MLVLSSGEMPASASNWLPILPTAGRRDPAPATCPCRAGEAGEAAASIARARAQAPPARAGREKRRQSVVVVAMLYLLSCRTLLPRGTLLFPRICPVCRGPGLFSQPRLGAGHEPCDVGLVPPDHEAATEHAKASAAQRSVQQGHYRPGSRNGQDGGQRHEPCRSQNQKPDTEGD